MSTADVLSPANENATALPVATEGDAATEPVNVHLQERNVTMNNAQPGIRQVRGTLLARLQGRTRAVTDLSAHEMYHAELFMWRTVEPILEPEGTLFGHGSVDVHFRSDGGSRGQQLDSGSASYDRHRRQVEIKFAMPWDFEALKHRDIVVSVQGRFHFKAHMPGRRDVHYEGGNLLTVPAENVATPNQIVKVPAVPELARNSDMVNSMSMAKGTHGAYEYIPETYQRGRLVAANVVPAQTTVRKLDPTDAPANTETLRETTGHLREREHDVKSTYASAGAWQPTSSVAVLEQPVVGESTMANVGRYAVEDETQEVARVHGVDARLRTVNEERDEQTQGGQGRADAAQ